MKGSIKILFVDNEGGVLRSLHRGLRNKCSDWVLEYSQSPIEALESIQAEAPCIVVCEKRMPEMDGVVFLQKVAELVPEAMRVILSGDVSSYTAAQSASVAHILLPKPFDLDEVESVLFRASCLRDLPINFEQRCSLGAVKSLPVLPEVYQKLQSYLKSTDDIDPVKIADIISQDVAILSKILQLANSSFFGVSHPAVTAKDAVVRMGVELIKQLVLTIGLFQQCDQNKNHYRALFDYAQQVAVLMAEFSRSANPSKSRMDAAYITGMLHNIGSLIPEEENSCVDHALSSAYLLKLWGFDDRLVERVLYQDWPENSADESNIVYDLYVAKTWIKGQMRGLEKETLVAQMPPEIIRNSSLNSYLEKLST